jgi:hypothetical protein
VTHPTFVTQPSFDLAPDSLPVCQVCHADGVTVDTFVGTFCLQCAVRFYCTVDELGVAHA